MLKSLISKYSKDVAANKKVVFIITVAIFVGLILRLWHIDFGLFHSFYADEVEFAEPAIKYTFEAKNYISNNDWHKFIPISFVYGTFPVYLFTIATFIFSKTMNLLNVGFEKIHIYIFLRTTSAIATTLIIPVTGILALKLFKNKWVAVLATVFTALNWKLIAHAHYLNADILLVLTLMMSFLFAIYYFESKNSFYVWLMAIFMGLSVGTKVTAGLNYIFFLIPFLVKKDLKGLAGFILISYGTFAITNPFSMIFLGDKFGLRIIEMITKENGLVFDSVDTSPTKYLRALGLMVTPLVALLGFAGFFTNLKNKEKFWEHVFLVAPVILYFAFFTVGSRRVDRWLLPTLPIFIIYASQVIFQMRKYVSKSVFIILLAIVASHYLFYTALVTSQFKRHTPKSEAYLWMRNNTLPAENKYVITEEGLDPMNKLRSSMVRQFLVYENEGAQFVYPENPIGYHYIVLSSRPMENFKRPEVREKYPYYVSKWDAFEAELYDSGRYELIKSFVGSKPNLIPLSDVYIFRNLDPVL